MNRLCLIVFCVFPAFIVGSEFGWSQEIIDAYRKFDTGYLQEFLDSSNRMPEYYRFIYESMHRPDGLVKMVEQSRTLDNTPFSENARRQLYDTIANEMFRLKQEATNKAQELFPDDLRHKMQTRQFQLAESVMCRLDSLEEVTDVFCANSLVTGGFHYDVLPDFLELTPEQHDLIATLQKNNEMERLFLMSRARVDQIEKSGELQALMDKAGHATNDGEREELFSKISSLEDEVFRHIAPQIKQLTQQYRENFMQVLTDAQKAKIEEVMADMPDYMKSLFAAIDKQGGGLSILNNWQPGMGVPSVPNPNREAPRERNGSSGRVFPGK